MLNIYGNSVSLDERTLDLLWERQNITMNNIANVDTPNYKARFITFENFPCFEKKIRHFLHCIFNFACKSFSRRDSSAYLCFCLRCM